MHAFAQPPHGTPVAVQDDVWVGHFVSVKRPSLVKSRALAALLAVVLDHQERAYALFVGSDARHPFASRLHKVGNSTYVAPLADEVAPLVAYLNALAAACSAWQKEHRTAFVQGDGWARHVACLGDVRPEETHLLVNNLKHKLDLLKETVQRVVQTLGAG